MKSVPDDCTAVGIPARVISKGKDKSQLSHNKIPDINKQLFIYLSKRLSVLEDALLNHHEDVLVEKDKELEQIYKDFIDTMDN